MSDSDESFDRYSSDDVDITSSDRLIAPSAYQTLKQQSSFSNPKTSLLDLPSLPSSFRSPSKQKYYSRQLDDQLISSVPEIRSPPKRSSSSTLPPPPIPPQRSAIQYGLPPPPVPARTIESFPTGFLIEHHSPTKTPGLPPPTTSLPTALTNPPEVARFSSPSKRNPYIPPHPSIHVHFAPENSGFPDYRTQSNGPPVRINQISDFNAVPLDRQQHFLQTIASEVEEEIEPDGDEEIEELSHSKSKSHKHHHHHHHHHHHSSPTSSSSLHQRSSPSKQQPQLNVAQQEGWEEVEDDMNGSPHDLPQEMLYTPGHSRGRMDEHEEEDDDEGEGEEEEGEELEEGYARVTPTPPSSSSGYVPPQIPVDPTSQQHIETAATADGDDDDDYDEDDYAGDRQSHNPTGGRRGGGNGRPVRRIMGLPLEPARPPRPPRAHRNCSYR